MDDTWQYWKISVSQCVVHFEEERPYLKSRTPTLAGGIK